MIGTQKKFIFLMRVHDQREQIVDIRLSIVKPLGDQWLMELYDYMIQKPKLLLMDFVDVEF